jgi:hypothetical protein
MHDYEAIIHSPGHPHTSGIMTALQNSSARVSFVRVEPREPQQGIQFENLKRNITASHSPRHETVIDCSHVCYNQSLIPVPLRSFLPGFHACISGLGITKTEDSSYGSFLLSLMLFFTEGLRSVERDRKIQMMMMMMMMTMMNSEYLRAWKEAILA